LIAKHDYEVKLDEDEEPYLSVKILGYCIDPTSYIWLRDCDDLRELLTQNSDEDDYSTR